MLIKNARLMYSDLFTSREYQKGDGKPRYGITVLIKKGSADDKAVQAAIQQEAKARWGDKAKQTLARCEGNSGKYCYTDGSLKENPECEGMMVLAAHRADRLGPPGIRDTDGRTELLASSGRPYNGCFINAHVEIYCQSGENTGVRSSFTAVQYAGPGEHFSKNSPAAAVFDDLGEGAEDDAEIF